MFILKILTKFTICFLWDEQYVGIPICKTIMIFILKISTFLIKNFRFSYLFFLEG